METLLAGAIASFLPAKLLPARPDTAMVADAAAIAVDGGAQKPALLGVGVGGGLRDVLSEC
jgi:hypothetical protein